MQYAVAGSRLVLSEAEAPQALVLIGKSAFFAFGVDGWNEQLRTIHSFDFAQGTLPTNGGAPLGMPNSKAATLDGWILC